MGSASRNSCAISNTGALAAPECDRPRPPAPLPTLFPDGSHASALGPSPLGLELPAPRPAALAASDSPSPGASPASSPRSRCQWRVPGGTCGSRVLRCDSRLNGDTSIRCTPARAVRNAGNERVARKMSLMSVPRPGPASMSRMRGGRPMASQHATHQTPTSSPKTWLTSGDVVKSPVRPKTSRLM
eukprot:scaffold4173_cov117-Isochrysis_galbana.AAC.8